ncbi:hypothetical protein BH20ACT22_BH20ACT22_11800 [soil metagenome]
MTDMVGTGRAMWAERRDCGRLRDLPENLDEFLVRSPYVTITKSSAPLLLLLQAESDLRCPPGQTDLVFAFIDDQDELIYWRQGRSLPYGEGITFWALGEIVKAQAGILESDSPETAADKLRVAVEAVVEATDERTWFVARLSPLVGAQASVSGGEGGAEKEESFTAWRGFLEAIAARSPLVLVFEDLHWADAAMLEFIDHLVEWSTGVPLLVVCTARPELYESHQGWGGGKRNSVTIALSSLSDSETAQLISALLSQAVLPAEVHAALLERAGGNPLYAEEFIRMLSDRNILQRRGRVLTIDPDADITIPGNVQALIAARLDTLAADRKALLHDAAVAGKVFWSGAISVMGGRDDKEVREGLHELARKELVRPARNSSMEGQQEYSFWHALVRDVAYGQIPRATRGAKHLAMAEWIEAIAGDRVGDQAEVLVHHYTLAFNLAKAAGDVEAENLTEPTLRFLILAGDRAIELDVAKARDYLGRALDLFPSNHPLRAPTLVKAGICAREQGSLEESQHAYEEAIMQAERDGIGRLQGEAMLRLANLWWWKGNSARSDALRAEAIDILERYPPGWELARAYGSAAGQARSSGRLKVAMELSEKALAFAQLLDDEKAMVDARCELGAARCDVGDLGGLEDLRRAVRDGLSLGLGHDTSVYYSFLAEYTWLVVGVIPALQVYEDYIQFADRRGLMTALMYTKAESLRVLFDLGEWEEIVRSARDLLRWGEAHHNPQVEVTVLLTQAQVLLYRGRSNEAAAIQERLIGLARDIEDLQVLVPALAVTALVEQAPGRTRQAVALIDELDHLTKEHHGWRARCMPTAVRVLILADEVDEAHEFLSEMDVSAARDRHSVLTGKAIVTEATGRLEEARGLYSQAAQRWADYGFVLEEGQAYLGLARCLISLGDRDAATESLLRAWALFANLDARPLLDEVDRISAKATALSS